MTKFAKRWERPEVKAVAQAMIGMMNAIGDPQTITLAGGAPAKEGFPIDSVREITNDIMRADKRGVEALQYGTALGVKDLREAIVKDLLPPYGVNADIKNVMITSGGIEIMGLVCEAFVDPGDVILVESPTFVQSVLSFLNRGAVCIGCKMDDQGLVISDVEEKIKRHSPKIIYTIPNFHNPTGKTLPEDRRRQLVELAERYDVIILEDDPYRDIRFNGEAIKSIKSFDKTGHVVMANSFSKIFSPGCRLGYLVASDEIMEQMITQKYGSNTHSAVPQQVICAEFFKRGYFSDHVAKLRKVYKEHCDVMMKCIDKYFPAETKHTVPDGGLFTWVELPHGFDTDELLKESMAKINVAFMAGSCFFTEGGNAGKNCMRISYSTESSERIEEAIKSLGALIKEKIKK